jgi:hypothetical protein
VSQAGSVPHTHSSVSPALFNQDHDRILLATSGVVAIREASPLLFAFLVVTHASVHTANRLDTAAGGTTDSRAPPLS